MARIRRSAQRRPSLLTGATGYYWAFEKVGFAVKSSEKYYAKVKPTSSCSGAR